jgi:tellurite methyltransferase
MKKQRRAMVQHGHRASGNFGSWPSLNIQKAWDGRWGSQKGREEWLIPAEAVRRELPTLKKFGARRALDLGCGVGRHSLFLARSGLCVFALDASANGIKFAREAAKKQGTAVMEESEIRSQAEPPPNSIVFRQGSMTELPDDWTMDYVLAWNVIYHGTLEVMEQSLREIHRVLASSPARARAPGIFQSTFLSKKNGLFGKGQEIAPNTFVIPDSEDEDKRHPVRFAHRAVC